MGAYVNMKCRACGKSLTHGYIRDYAGIGEPLVECPNCKAVSSHADKVTEWLLMSGFRKFWLFVTLGWSTVFFYGVGGTALATVLAIKDVIGSTMAVIAIIATSLAIGFIRLFLYFRKRIRLSGERMANPAYRQKLRRHGVG